MDRRLGLANEEELWKLFDDCDLGAAPPVGAAYHVPTVVDDRLTGLDRVWFEGGDHRTLAEMRGKDFDRLMKGGSMAPSIACIDPGREATG